MRLFQLFLLIVGALLTSVFVPRIFKQKKNKLYKSPGRYAFL